MGGQFQEFNPKTAKLVGIDQFAWLSVFVLFLCLTGVLLRQYRNTLLHITSAAGTQRNKFS